MTKINFAIIGCGRIAYRHIEAIEANEQAHLVAICDLNQAKAQERYQESTSKPKIYQDYYQMLDNEDIDVVCIMTPSGMHPEHAMDIIEKYQKHLIIEKPVALQPTDGEKLLEVAQKHQVRVFPVHQNRFNKAIKKIKQAVDDNYFGKISLATIRIRWSRGQAYYDRDPWRGTWAMDGGALTNQSIHHIDILQWLMGEVESLSAITKTQFVNVDVEDTGCAWVKFKNGALGVIEATTTVRPNIDLEASISVMGENGTAIVEGAAVNKITTWTFEPIDLEAHSENPPNVYGFGHNILIDNVVDTLNGKSEQLISLEDGLNAVRLLNAIYRSSELGGKEVFLKDNPVSEKFGVFNSESEQIADLYRTSKVLQ